MAQSQKTMMTGQLSLFDLVGEEEKASFQAKLPDVEEYSKELLLSFEKEVLGVYVSGHPLEEYEDRWKKNITAVTTDFHWMRRPEAARSTTASRWSSAA